VQQGSRELKNVIIEDDVWIGQRVIILPGVTLQIGTIVGAGSVVTKTFPPFSVLVGNPARLIKSRQEK
jgi:maltose O-acetyltransferase